MLDWLKIGASACGYNTVLTIQMEIFTGLLFKMTF